MDVRPNTFGILTVNKIKRKKKLKTNDRSSNSFQQHTLQAASIVLQSIPADGSHSNTCAMNRS